MYPKCSLSKEIYEKSRAGLLGLLLIFSLNLLQAQTGYIYVHLKSINEENSTDFSFTLQNSLGITTNTFSLNDEATADNVALSGNNLHVYDMGLSHGTGGDGQLWVVAGTSFGSLNSTTTLTGTVYYRNSGTSRWQQPATAITNAKYIDGAYANQFVYINSSNNVIFYNNGTTTTIYTGGDAWDVTANGGRIAISTATAIKLYSNSYTTLGISTFGASWSTLVTPGSKSRIDMNLAGTTIVYQAAGGSNTVSTVTTGGVTASLGAVGIGAANNTDVAYDDNGVVYANANNTTSTDLIYHYSGGVWTAETQSRTLSTLTGGVASLVYTNDVPGGTTVESIYSRQTDNLGNVYWIDDERVKNSSSLNGNGIIIPVSPGTYTLTETLPNSTYDVGRYNIYDPGGSTTGNVSTQVVTYVVTANKIAFAEYVNEKLNPYSVNFPACNTPYYLQSFDANNSSPVNVTPTFGNSTAGTVSYGTPYSGTAYHYSNVSSPQDGYYYLVNIENATDWFVNTGLNDHTGNNGFFLLVNASYTLDEFYRQRLTNLVVGATYKVTYWAANVNPPPALIYPNIKIGIQDNTGTVVSSASTGNIASTTWTQYSLTFTATTVTTDLFLSNNNVGGYGNDLAIDDIQIQLVSTPVASGIESCTGTGTITVSSPVGSQYLYSDNGGSSYQASPTFTGLAAGTNTVAAKYVGAGSGCVSNVPIVIIPTSSIYGLDQTGLVYGVGTAGTLTTAYNNTNKPTTSTTAEAIGYTASTGIFYYFLNNASTYTFNSYNPSITTSSAYTTLASPPSGTGTIYIGGTTADGNGYYAIDSKGYLYYYNIAENTWTTITTLINDNQVTVTSLTSKIASGEYYGDITEDAYGDLFFLIGSGSVYGLYEVLAPVSATAQASITANQIIKYSSNNPGGISGHWSGMAFDATGNLYITTSGGQLWEIPIGSTTPSKVTGTNMSVTMTDLAQCSYTTNPLPLTWLLFNAVLNNGAVDVNWDIVQVSSIRGFYVERSTDSKNWDKIAFVPYTDNNSVYSFNDANPAAGTNYYRVEKVDYDNTNNFSDIGVVDVATPSNDISVWPNPATDVLHVFYNGSSKNMSAIIVDELGRKVMKSPVYQGNNSIAISTVPPGVYFLMILDFNKNMISKKIIKKSN